jgi:hypothetical protein
VANWKWHIESHYPTQANRRLEWGTQRLLPVGPKKKLRPLASILHRGVSRSTDSPMILIALAMS